MKKTVIAVLAVLVLVFTTSSGSARTIRKEAGKQASKKSKAKKKLTGQQVAKIKKRAETEGKRLEYESRYRGYREMLEAQQRGMRQTGAARQQDR